MTKLSGLSGVDHFGDDDSTLSTDMIMTVPQQKNFMVLSTELGKPCSSSTNDFNLANFSNSLGGPSQGALERETSWFYGLISSSGSWPYSALCLLFFLIFFPWTVALVVGVVVLIVRLS